MPVLMIAAGLGGWGGTSQEERRDAWQFMLTALKASSPTIKPTRVLIKGSCSRATG